MKTAGWCWHVAGGLIAIWSDMQAAVNWDGTTVNGRLEWDEATHDWVIRLNRLECDNADIYHSYDLDGMEA